MNRGIVGNGLADVDETMAGSILRTVTMCIIVTLAVEIRTEQGQEQICEFIGSNLLTPSQPLRCTLQ
jgi:hypothetical protein